MLVFWVFYKTQIFAKNNKLHKNKDYLYFFYKNRLILKSFYFKKLLKM